MSIARLPQVAFDPERRLVRMVLDHIMYYYYYYYVYEYVHVCIYIYTHTYTYLIVCIEVLEYMDGGDLHGLIDGRREAVGKYESAIYIYIYICIYIVVFLSLSLYIYIYTCVCVCESAWVGPFVRKEFTQGHKNLLGPDPRASFVDWAC